MPSPSAEPRSARSSGSSGLRDRFVSPSISASVHVSKDGRRVINYSQWKSVKDIEAMRQHPDVGPYMKRVGALGTFEAIACEVSYVHHGG